MAFSVCLIDDILNLLIKSYLGNVTVTFFDIC